MTPSSDTPTHTHFDLAAFRAGGVVLGEGNIGNKAQGLVFFHDMLTAEFDQSVHPEIQVHVPGFAVITAEFFDAFLDENDLSRESLAGRSDEEIAQAVHQATLPDALLAELDCLIEHVDVPLAVRSSSRLEDAVFAPFAGVYETKMIPNNQSDRSVRLQKLVESVKFVYASTFVTSARTSLEAAGHSLADEGMAVIVQELVGGTFGDRFYPHLSGVARTYNFYPSGGSRPEDGVVMLALGLGKTIADGGICWTFSPKRPKAPPPYGSAGDQLKNSQLSYWAVNLAGPDAADPLIETEYLAREELARAEADGVLKWIASTYDGASDRFVSGIGRRGPRMVDFAPLLQHRMLPLVEVLTELMAISERAAGAEVEIEFALSMPAGGNAAARLGLLQVRPMVVSHARIEIESDELERDDLVLASRRAIGNGYMDNVRDVVFVKPATFEPRHTRRIAAQIQELNAELLQATRRYLLIGFGRWGSADPWLGIPVDWSQICGAATIVESTLPEMNVEASQGSHFFHNLMNCGVSYLSVRHAAEPGIDWDWLQSQPIVRETEHVVHVELRDPLTIKVDGRSGSAAVWR